MDILLEDRSTRKVLAIIFLDKYIGKGKVKSVEFIASKLNLKETTIYHWSYFGDHKKRAPHVEDLKTIIKELGMTNDNVATHIEQAECSIVPLENREEFDELLKIAKENVVGYRERTQNLDKKLYTIWNHSYRIYYYHFKDNYWDLEWFDLKTKTLNEDHIDVKLTKGPGRIEEYEGKLYILPTSGRIAISFYYKIPGEWADVGVMYFPFSALDIKIEPYVCGIGVMCSIERNTHKPVNQMVAIIDQKYIEGESATIEEYMRDNLIGRVENNDEYYYYITEINNANSTLVKETNKVIKGKEKEQILKQADDKSRGYVE